MNTSHVRNNHFTGKEGSEEHPTEMCPPSSTGATAARCSSQHSQTRGWTVQQGGFLHIFLIYMIYFTFIMFIFDILSQLVTNIH